MLKNILKGLKVLKDHILPMLVGAVLCYILFIHLSFYLSAEDFMPIGFKMPTFALWIKILVGILELLGVFWFVGWISSDEGE